MSLFNPSRDEVRRFFIAAWTKSRTEAILTPLETLAADWMDEHPEYHEVLGAADAEVRDFPPEGGMTNPFLHLSMHLSISEQVSIDQPPGIRDAATRLATRLGSMHEAQHVIMECLGEMLWASQRNGLPPDGEAYIACVERHAQG